MAQAEEQEQLDDIRRVLAEGIGYLQGEAYTDFTNSLTFSAFLAEAISVIENDQSDIRPGKLNGLRSLKERVQSAVERAVQLPGELFEVVVEEEQDA